MNAAKMIQLCDAALDKLDELEGVLAYIPPAEEASSFMYASAPAVRELMMIARLETINNVTVQQAKHIRKLMARLDYLLNLVSRNTGDSFNGEKDK